MGVYWQGKRMNGRLPEGNQSGLPPSAISEEIHERGQEIQAIFRVWAEGFPTFGRSAKERIPFLAIAKPGFSGKIVYSSELFHLRN